MMLPSQTQKIPWSHRLSVKIGTWLLIVIIVSSLAAGLVMNEFEKRRFEKRSKQHAHEMSSLLVKNLSERMLQGGGAKVWQDISRISHELMETAGAERIEVLSRQGHIKASTDTFETGIQYPLETQAECVACHKNSDQSFPLALTTTDKNGQNVLRVISMIPKLNQCQLCHKDEEAFRGMLLVDFSYAEATQATRTRGTFIIILAIFATIFIWGLIVFLLRRRIYQPVHHLIAAFTQLGEGDLTTRAKVLSDDELGELTQDFNVMAERLQVQVQELERKNIEVTLLYNLVDRASQSMEPNQLQHMIVEVMTEKLSIEMMMFMITLEQQDSIVCTGNINQASDNREGGVSQLNKEEAQNCIQLIPDSLLENTLQSREPVKIIRDGNAWFAISIWVDGENIGYLTGATTPGNSPSNRLLKNLAAHICLAIENSQNYSHSITDPMTKMHTKGYGLARIDEAIQTFKRTERRFGLLILDLDHFKQVNDTYGHLAGDQVLREATKRIRKRLRRSDIGIRYGGEEFITLLCDVDEKMLSHIAEEFRQSLAAESIPLHNDNNDRLPITMSVGGTLVSIDDSKPEDIIERADQALYKAKKDGRDRVVIAK